MSISEVPDSGKVFRDEVFEKDNDEVADEWIRIGEVYPNGANEPLLPETFSREQFGQGKHYECFMLSTLATLVRYPDVIRRCFVTKKVRQDGRYTFQFFRGKEWVKVEIDDRIAMEEGEVLYACSPTEHWWPLLLEKAYAKFYTGYDNIEGCTLQETFHDLTGLPVLNIPMDAKLAKTAGADVAEGSYWLDLAQKIQNGMFVASVLTKDMELENMGLQRDQQYGVLDIFSLTGTSSVNDIVVHMHNPFEDEEFIYKGPMNPKDGAWTAKLKAKYDVDNERSIFLPLSTLLKIVNSLQLCYVTTLENDATYYDDCWKGETAGGNPTSCTWRKNPLYFIKNSGKTAVDIVVMIKQEDQRRFTSPDEMTMYLQCGIILTQYSYPNPIPTFWVTGNNHKPIHKSLFLNSREVSNPMTVPLESTCYLVPSGMNKGAEGEFTLALYRVKNVDYSDITIRKLEIPEMDWKNPATKEVELRQKEKDRVDFVVDEATDIHILNHQMKPFISKSGGDAMTEDYMGMYLYDDTDRKIGGVHAATNFREVSIIHHLPRSGRFAISLTCPRAKGDVPSLITIVGSHASNVRIVDPPEDATMFDDEDEIIEDGDAGEGQGNPIDYFPAVFDKQTITEVPDSNNLYEDKRFLVDNKNVTNEPWVHIGDLYPEGKTQPLLPEKLSRDQFEQGENYECCAITAFAGLVDKHPDVIKNCFITKAPRKDGRYTFQFHRYGQWMKVEIDDRIPCIDGKTAYCRSPTRNWWPLLLEKAYAKFYTLYQNLEGCTQQEVFHDFTGRPVISIQTDPVLARAANYDVEDPEFWTQLDKDLPKTALAGLTKMDVASKYGMNEDQSYSILGCIPISNTSNPSLNDIAVKLYNPFVEANYTGPLSKNDARWPSDMRQILNPDDHSLIYMPVPVFCEVFLNIQQAWIKGPLEPGWNFNSEWGEGTNGGNPMLVTWRENPLYVVDNKKNGPSQIIAMIRQPDQRHLLHLSSTGELNYIQCGLILAESTNQERIPTYLVTGNNHRTVHKGLFLNSREVANVITVPEESMCYLVPSAMYRDMGKFILSYWYINEADKRELEIVRYQPDVAKHLPAIDHLELRHKEKDRVDFLIDVPTDIHILLKQEKPFKNESGGDAMAQDFLACYLYDEDDKRVTGTLAATNYREIGLVHHLNDPGRYALTVTCPNGHGEVPVKVEVVGLEKAHVRITDPPEDAEEIFDVDLAFLDPEPEGVPLAYLPLDTDPQFQEDLEALRKLLGDPDANEDEIEGLKKRLNDRAHELAKDYIGKDRGQYLPDKDLEKLGRLMNANKEYMELEKERHDLKKDPKNADKLRGIEDQLRAKADEIEEYAKLNDLSFLDPEIEGIPRDDLNLMDDPEFSELAMKRMQYMQDPAANATKINEIEDAMHDRAVEIAKEMHDKERVYLDPEPEGVPLSLLPLNEDEPFSKMEDELRALKKNPAANASRIKDLEDRLNDRAHELARKLKDDERDLFLDPQPLGVPVDDLPLDSDPQFHDLETERLRLRKEDPIGNKDRIHDLEDAMNERARELAQEEINGLRGFLDQEPRGIPLEDLGLDYNDDFNKLEDELRKLKKDPNANPADIEDVKEKMRGLVDDLAQDALARDRAFLDPEPEGRLVETLPLDENPDFVTMEKGRRALKASGGNQGQIEDLEKAMNDLAHDIAHQLNKDERPDYLEPTFKGINHEDLPLDDDKEFRDLEAKRQVLKRDPNRNATAIRDTEDDLNKRADELAGEMLAADRDYLDQNPEGVPLYLVPIDKDPQFTNMEAQRAQLKKDPQTNARGIADLEDQLNARAAELAKDLKDKERAKFLDPRPGGIPWEELPLDDDDTFRDLEVQRLILNQDPRKNAAAIKDLDDALNARAEELGRDMKERERAFLDPAPLGIPLEELPLDSNREFIAKEDELRQLRKDPSANADQIAALEDELNELARAIAAKELSGNRDFLDPEPEGRLLEELPLDTDPEFHDMELEYRELKKDPRGNADRIAELEELMNDRAHQLAKEMNAAERPSYMNPAPLGVALEELPLDTDPEFASLEAQRAKLRRDPEGNRDAIAALEKALNDRAEELAKEKIKGDRDYIDEEPQGIPREFVLLDQDPKFKAMEAERADLKARGISSADPRMRELESAMNERANEVARAQREAVRNHYLPAKSSGIPREALPLDDDMPFNDLETAHIMAGDDEAKKRDLADAMEKRAADVALKVRAEERANLGTPLGYDPSQLPLDENQEYMNKETELIALRADPKANAAEIAAAEQELRDIALEMAKERADAERTYLDEDLEGRRPEDIDFLADPAYAELEEEYHREKNEEDPDEERLADLENLMNLRARELARMKNAEDRPNFIQEQRNVPLHELPLDTDEEFKELEAERARLMENPNENASAIRAIEEKMNDRVAVLTDEALKGDRIFLDDVPEGVPQRQVDLDNDPKFRDLEQQRAALKAEDPRKNAAAIRDLEEQMNDRLHELANETKWDARNDMDPEPCGVPLKDLGAMMDADPEFTKLEEMYRDARNDPDRKREADQLLQQMNERAKELADELHEKERANLDQEADGIPLDALPLNEDEKFLALENEARRLENEPNGAKKNAERLADLDDQMNQRAKELANELRKDYIDPEPEGIPIELLNLGDDPDFVDKENELRRLQKNPIANGARIADLKKELNDMAHEKARDMLQNDRDYLDPNPEGVDLRHLPLDTDPQFREMEAERARLKAEDPKKNQRAIEALEGKLNDRAHELAKELKDAEANVVKSRSLPIGLVNPHDDAEFNDLAQQKRNLELDPSKNAAALREIKEQMRNRAEQLADKAVQGDRGYLNPNPEGVPLADLPLDTDPKFHELELERAKLKASGANPAKLQDLEDQLNARAEELARDQKKKDLEGLDKKPEGIPIDILDPHNDEEFASYLPELRELKKDPKANKDAIADIQGILNDRAHELAKEKIRGDRPKYVEDVVDGVPRDLLPLDTDPTFRDLETQRAILRLTDPRRNADKIKDLEEKLNNRAHELAEEQKKKDLENLDQNPEGVPLSILKPHEDPEFAKMVDEHRELMKDPQANADAIRDLEDQMDERLKELAREMKNNDRAFLDPEPEGIPIEDVPLDQDKDFLLMEDYLRKLKKDPRRNAQQIKDTQEKMNDRAHELAKGVANDDLANLPPSYNGIPTKDLNLHDDPEFREAANKLRKLKKDPNANPDDIEDAINDMDRIAQRVADDQIAKERAFLDPEPRGVPLSELPLDTDPEFKALEEEKRKLSKDPRAAKRNKEAIQKLEEKMKDRVDELAKEHLDNLRGEFMDPEPEGIPLAKLPLDTDPEFKRLEQERLDELKKENPDMDKVKDLEDQMNDRAAEIAKQERDKDRAFLDPEPEGVPLNMLPLDKDPEFQELAKQRQALKAAGKSNRDPAVKDLEKKMNDRVHDLAKEFLDNNRDYLDPEPEGVPLSDLPLNKDPVFREMENELLKLQQDPEKNKDKIEELKEDLNDRAKQLAQQQLKRERAGQDQEPLGVPLELLPLNQDPEMQRLEKQRRELKKDPRKNADALRKVEADIDERAKQLAQDYLDKEREFMDPEPEGVPLSELKLSDDPKFHEMEKELRELNKNPEKNRDAIEDLKDAMNERAHELAKDFLAKDRGFLEKDPRGVPLDLLPLNEDPEFQELEKQRRELKKNPAANPKDLKDLENRLNDRADELAKEYLDKERAFMDPEPEGIPLNELPLDKDKKFRDLEKKLRELKKDPRKNADAIKDVQDAMDDRAHELAKRQLAADRKYLNGEPRGVPTALLDLDNDEEFRDLERKLREAKKDPNRADEVRDLEDRLNERADAVAREFLKNDRAYLDPEPEGVPLEELPLDEDLDFKGMENERRRLKKDENKNGPAIGDLERKLNDRAHVLAKEKKGYQDPDFHAANEDIAELWPRIRELYPEGVYEPVTPVTTLPSDVSSAPEDFGFLAPFIAALARHPVMISRLFQDEGHPYMKPYRITLFNPDSSPVTVEIDDRVPCDANREPKFTRVPTRMWYPLLLEKAYAKFIGGYENFNNCNAHDTLRDLTGRPVVHISLEDPKHAAAQNLGDFTQPAFWRRVAADFARGDIYVCVSNADVPNGLHPQCCYSLMDIVQVQPGSDDPNDIILKVHNCYTDEPVYNGPLRKGDSNWTADVRRACNYDEEESDVLYIPLPTFLDNFSCMQRCHINCGDRLSSPGEWNEFTSGGTSKFTTFRNNPIYMVENKTARPVTILAEVRHSNPMYIDEMNCKRYPYTGLTLMQPIDPKMPATPFITNGTHKFLQKGMMLDSREVCSEMELPPSSTCYLIPYTKDRGTLGNFHVSIYPDAAKVTLTPVRHGGLTLKPLKEELKIDPNDGEGKRVDFMINEACDVHILLHQNEVSDPNSVRRGDAVGESEVALSAFNEYGIKIGTTGEPSNAREHALVFKAPQAGRYSLLATCVSSEPCPASLEIYTPKDIEAELVPVDPDAKPLNVQSSSRFPSLARTRYRSFTVW